MSFYIEAPVTTDPSVLKQRFTDYLAAYSPPGFQLQPGHPLNLLAEAGSQVAAEQGTVTSGIMDAAFRYIGSLFNLPPIDPTPATATVTIDVQDTAGYTVHAGANVFGLPDSTGTLQAFDLTADVVIPAGSSSATGTIQAEDPGTVCNGLSGTATLIQAESYVVSASIGMTGNGVDGELDSAYLDRLAETFTIITPRPILAKDFAILARAVAGVYRAVGVDNLKPGPPYDSAAEATGVEKNITVAVADVNGQSVGSTIRGNVKTFLQSYLTQNSVVWVVDPQSTAIDVTATGVFAWPGWNTAAVQAAVIAALQRALSPATFGTDPSGSAARWANDPYVRADYIAETIRAVPGVRYMSPQPTFGVHGGVLQASDVQLGAGSAIPALPAPGTITVTVTATS